MVEGSSVHTLQPPLAVAARQTLPARGEPGRQPPGSGTAALARLPLGPPTLRAARRLEPLQIKGCPGHRANLAEMAAPSHFTVCLGNNRKAFAKLERRRVFFFFLMRGSREKEKAGQGRRG